MAEASSSDAKEPPYKRHPAVPTGRVPYDPTWYSWKQFFRIQTGQAAMPEVVRYLHMQSVENEASDCAKCDRNVDWLLKYSPTVRFMQDNINRVGGSLKRENIKCMRCDSLSDKGRVKGAFGPDGMLLCANHVRTRSGLEDVMAHEMVHTYDWLRFRIDEKDLRHAACTEIRANLLSGECRWSKEFFEAGQFKFTNHFQDCVRRRAVLWLIKRPNCPDDTTAVKAVNSVWDSCFADTRPFDEVYR